MVVSRRSDYLDVIRAVAILLVVYMHSIDHMARLYHFDDRYGAYFIHGLLRDIGRIGVPLFFMVSGALLLGKNIEILPFYKKRLPRLVFSVMIIPLAYNFFCTFLLGLPWQNMIIIKILSGNPGYAYHLWFIYTTIGIYLAAPFIKSFLKGSSNIMVICYIVISFVLGFVPRLVQSLFGITIPYVMMDFFNPYVTYFVVGYYLHHVFGEFGPKKVTIFFCILCVFLVIPALILQFFNVYGNDLMMKSDMLSWHDKPFTFITAICAFMILKSILNPRKIDASVMRWVRIVSSSSYTTYLFHLGIIYTFEYFCPTGYVKFSISIIFLILLCFVICCLINAAVKRVPFIKNMLC